MRRVKLNTHTAASGNLCVWNRIRDTSRNGWHEIRGASACRCRSCRPRSMHWTLIRFLGLGNFMSALHIVVARWWSEWKGKISWLHKWSWYAIILSRTDIIHESNWEWFSIKTALGSRTLRKCCSSIFFISHGHQSKWHGILYPLDPWRILAEHSSQLTLFRVHYYNPGATIIDWCIQRLIVIVRKCKRSIQTNNKTSTHPDLSLPPLSTLTFPINSFSFSSSPRSPTSYVSPPTSHSPSPPNNLIFLKARIC